MSKPRWAIDVIPPRARDPGADRSFAALVVHLVAAATAAEPRDILGETRSRERIARARQIAMYLAHTGLNWTQGHTGEVFGRDRSTVAYACKKVEGMREDRQFDHRIGRLESWLRALPVEGPLL